MALSVRQAAKRIGCSPATVRRWCRDGRIPCTMHSFKEGYKIEPNVIDRCILHVRDKSPQVIFEPETTHERIRTVRKKLRMTSFEAAVGMDMDPYNYSLIERGKKTPTCLMIKRIAKFYGVTTDYLLCMDVFKEEV